TRYNPERVELGEMLSVEDVQEILSLQLLGIVPESKSILTASNSGMPVILDEESDAGQAYSDIVARYLGEDRPQRFIKKEKKGLLQKLSGGKSGACWIISARGRHEQRRLPSSACRSWWHTSALPVTSRPICPPCSRSCWR